MSDATPIIHTWGEHDLAREKMAQRFREWGEMAAEYDSPLYGVLADGVSKDDALLSLAMQRMPSQPPENMLFAASHFLLMRSDSAEPLRQYYPNLTPNPLPPEGAFEHFRTFCLANQDALLALLQTRRTQTNAVRRCTFLLPAFLHIAQRLNGQPMAQIEVGCSAGLNLRWDRFGYAYDERRVGRTDSGVQLTTVLRGGWCAANRCGVP